MPPCARDSRRSRGSMLCVATVCKRLTRHSRVRYFAPSSHSQAGGYAPPPTLRTRNPHRGGTNLERRRHPCCLGPLRIPVAAYVSTCLCTSVPTQFPQRECSVPCLNYNCPIPYSICKTHQDCPHLSHAFIIRSQVSAECVAEHTIGCKRFSESSLNGCRKASPSNSLKTFNRFRLPSPHERRPRR